MKPHPRPTSPAPLGAEPLADPRQRQFCALVLLLGNASEAYRRAGYTGKANVQAAKMLALPAIQGELHRLRAVASGSDEVVAASGSADVHAIRQMRECMAAIARNPCEPFANRIAAIRCDARIMDHWKDF